MLKLIPSASVSGTTAPGGDKVYSVYDFITVACEKEVTSNCGHVTYSRLIVDKTEFKDQIVKFDFRLRRL